jgi:hypothetical protein
MLVHIEALKAQRDLYLAFRDLFARHDSKSLISDPPPAESSG